MAWKEKIQSSLLATNSLSWRIRYLQGMVDFRLNESYVSQHSVSVIWTENVTEFMFVKREKSESKPESAP